MFLISTRNFPPDIGGIQNLMEGLSTALLNHGPVKVFADSFEDSQKYDQDSKLNIQRISGFNFFVQSMLLTIYTTASTFICKTPD